MTARQYRPDDATNPIHYRDPEKGECIDAMPEHFVQWIRKHAPDTTLREVSAMVGWMMLGFCVGNAFKYRWRKGQKTGEAAEDAERKAQWNDAMALHTLASKAHPDPRDAP